MGRPEHISQRSILHVTFFPYDLHGIPDVVVVVVVVVDAPKCKPPDGPDAVVFAVVVLVVVFVVTASALGFALFVVTPPLRLGTNEKTKNKMNAHRAIIFLECSCTKFGTRFGRDLV